MVIFEVMERSGRHRLLLNPPISQPIWLAEESRMRHTVLLLETTDDRLIRAGSRRALVRRFLRSMKRSLRRVNCWKSTDLTIVR